MVGMDSNALRRGPVSVFIFSLLSLLLNIRVVSRFIYNELDLKWTTRCTGNHCGQPQCGTPYAGWALLRKFELVV